MAEWKHILVTNTSIKKSLIKNLTEKYGHDMTLGDLSNLSEADIRAFPRTGKSAVTSVVETIRAAMHGEPLIKSVRIIDLVHPAPVAVAAAAE